jgi:hypothetical protein
MLHRGSIAVIEGCQPGLQTHESVDARLAEDFFCLHQQRLELALKRECLPHTLFHG